MPNAISLCGPLSRQAYCAELQPGPHVVRPFNLGWRADFGLSGFIEPEQLIQLSELYLLEGTLVLQTLDLLCGCTVSSCWN